MDPKIIILILSAVGFASSSDSTCYYGHLDYIPRGYMCTFEATNPTSMATISGQHLDGYTDDNVELMFSSKLKISTFTSSYCEKFKNTKQINVEDSPDVTAFASNALKNCENLEEFRFIEGRLTELPGDLFSANSKLQVVSFQANRLTTLPENLFSNLNNLKKLELNENEINFLPSGIFNSLKNLQRLSLSRNQLNKLNPSWFMNLHSLREFAMSYNGFTDIPKNTFINCNDLKVAWLSGNEVTSIHADSFGSTQKLTDFFISDNKVNAIDRKFIDQSSSLTLIYMENNLCSETTEEYENKDEMKMELKQCFENYQPRQE